MAETERDKPLDTEENVSRQYEYKTFMVGDVPFTFDVTYAKSKLGICNAAEIILINLRRNGVLWSPASVVVFVRILQQAVQPQGKVLSLLALLIMRGGYPYYCISYHGIYAFYDWVSGSVFFTRLILYLLFTISIEDRNCPKIVPWLHLRVIILSIFTLFYFIASIAMAAGVCSYGVLITAMIVGFIITPVLGADFWFSLQELRNRPPRNRYVREEVQVAVF